MYDFLDRSLDDLDAGGLMMLWAARFWARALSRKECPTADVAIAFRSRGLEEAVPHFHLAMIVLNRHALIPLGIGNVPCRRVSEGEALLLSLLRRHDEPAHIRETLERTVQPNWVAPLRLALHSLSDQLVAHGLLPTTPAERAQGAAG